MFSDYLNQFNHFFPFRLILYFCKTIYKNWIINNRPNRKLVNFLTAFFNLTASTHAIELQGNQRFRREITLLYYFIFKN